MSSASDMPSPAVLRVADIDKTFLGTYALQGVSLEVRRGEILALLGGNGSGKSTLIKILAGVYEADAGGSIERVGEPAVLTENWSVKHSRDAQLIFVHQALGLFPGTTVAENIALGRGFQRGAAGRISWKETRARAAEVLDRFGIECEPMTIIDELRPADRTMVAIARALQDQEDNHRSILFLDEPTASLAATEVEVLHAALRRYAAAGQTIVYISHRLDEVQQLADRVVVLKDGRQVADLPTAKTTKRALVQLITGLTAAADEKAPGGDSSQDVLLTVRGLQAPPATSVSFDLRRGEVLGIAGLLGSGRTELLRSLFGAQPFAGNITLDGERVHFYSIAAAMRGGVAYVPEDRGAEGLFAEHSVAHNVSISRLWDYWSRGRLSLRREAQDSRHAVDEFLVKAAGVDVPISALSGGNQQKVVLARWLMRKPRLLLLDEPTQGVDIGARREIYGLVRAAAATGTGVIVVSSDFEELAAVCDRVLVLRDGQIVADVPHAELSSSRLTEITYSTLEDAI